MTTDCDEWIGIGTPSRVDRHAGKIDAVDEVRVGQLGREVEGDDVELAGRFVGVDREQRQPLTAQELFHVDPGGVGAVGSGIRAFVDDLVEDLESGVGQPDFVGVRVGEQPGGLVRPVFGGLHAVFTPDVARRLLHLGQERLKAGPEIGGRGAGWHRDRLPARFDRPVNPQPGSGGGHHLSAPPMASCPVRRTPVRSGFPLRLGRSRSGGGRRPESGRLRSSR